MGGGDLNMKKSWHPVLLVNQEKVWKAEKSANEEKKKLQQLRKEQEEERQLAELQRLQEQATGKKRVDKLDWMYAAPSNENGALGGAKISETMMEDYLLGKRRVDDVLAQGDRNVGAASKEFIAVQNANSARDTAAKIREDPLLAIRRQEQAALAAMANRPDIRRQLKAIKKEAGESKEERKARRKAEKEEKRNSRSEKKRSRGDDRSPRSEYSDDDRHYKRRSIGRDDSYRKEERYSRDRSYSPKRERGSRSDYGRDERSPRRYSRDDRERRYRDDSPRSRDHRDDRSNGHRARDERDSHDSRIPPPRHYPNGNGHSAPRDVKPDIRSHSSRPGALDMAERPTSAAAPSRFNGAPHQSSNGHGSNGNSAAPNGGGGNALDEQRAARLAAMSASATEMYSNREKTIAQRAEEERKEREKDELHRKKFGKEAAHAGFFKQQGEMGLGESLQRRAGKGLQKFD